jgi:hypothetical protein
VLNVLSGTPTSCSKGTSALEVETLSIRCDPKYTCVHSCSPCGKKIFYDVRNLAGYHSWSSNWKHFCNKIDPEEWAKKQLSASGFVSYSVRESVDKMLQKYVTMCKTGVNVYESELGNAFSKLYQQFSNKPNSQKDLSIAHSILTKFGKEVAGHAFEYCSCSSFASQIGKNSQFSSGIASACDLKCNLKEFKRTKKTEKPKVKRYSSWRKGSKKN